MPPLRVRFSAYTSGIDTAPAGVPPQQCQWRVCSQTVLCGDPLPAAETLLVTEGAPALSTCGSCSGGADGAAAWALEGVTTNLRYTTAAELAELQAKQEGLGRPTSTCAALIAISKSEKWWGLPQDERRAIAEKGGHIGHGAFALDYLPAISRRLHHCRELGGPYDFLTWFEYNPKDAPAFEELLQKLRATEEWGYVVRETDVRLLRV